AYATSLWPFQNSESESSIRDTNSVDYGPPTDQEIEESQNAKKNNYENNGQKNDEKSDNGDKTTTNKRSVNVGISYADVYNGNVEVRAFTGDVVEPGTCTVKITKG